jgi:hypothetical protein
MTTELWNSGRDQAGAPEFADRTERERWLLAYQDDNFGGRWFVPWTNYRHPELGQGEIGGWIPKYTGGNASPGESLTGVCETHWQFELFKAGLLPKLEITDVTAKVLYETNNASTATAQKDGDTVTIRRGGGSGRYQVVEVTATIANTGQLATQVARGANLAGNRQDAIWLLGDRDRMTFLQGNAFERIGVIDGVMEIPGMGGQSAAPGGRGASQGMPNIPMGMPPEMMQQFLQRGGGAQAAPQSGNTRVVTWLVAVEGNFPLKVILTSQRGGTVVRDVTPR